MRLSVLALVVNVFHFGRLVGEVAYLWSLDHTTVLVVNVVWIWGYLGKLCRQAISQFQIHAFILNIWNKLRRQNRNFVRFRHFLEANGCSLPAALWSNHNGWVGRPGKDCLINPLIQEARFLSEASAGEAWRQGKKRRIWANVNSCCCLICRFHVQYF